MDKFANEQYKFQVHAILKDVFLSDMSYDGKIARLRTYTEIIVRKMLDIPIKERMTMGGPTVIKKIQGMPYFDERKTVFDTINKFGSERTHTEREAEETEDKFEVVSKDNFDQMNDSVLDLMAFLFIDYFNKYKFGSRPEILYSFSLLPPILRYKVLSFLYKNDSCNKSIIDKLTLAILKTFGKTEAITWVQENKIGLQKVDMYEMCLFKINKVDSILDSKPIYLDFGSARPYYEKYGILDNNNNEYIEFNDIMSFLYMGRKYEEEFLDGGPIIHYTVLK